MASHNDKTSVVDADQHFLIDVVTREIQNNGDKNEVVQYDHNSERLTFECPRYVEGHDMSNCNKVIVNYLCGEAYGIYEIDDLKAESDKVTFSWLISSNVTQKIGKIYFAIMFQCVQDNGDVTYKWSTKITECMQVVEGMEYGGTIVYNNTDILEQWKAQLFGTSDGEISKIQQAADKIKDSLPSDYTELNKKVDTNADEISSLKEDLVDLNKILNIKNKTTYHLKEDKSILENWNIRVNSGFKANQSLRFILDEYTGNYLKQVRVLAYRDDGTCAVFGAATSNGQAFDVNTTEEYSYYLIQLQRSQTEYNVSATISVYDTSVIGYEDIRDEFAQTLYVEKDGTGDYNRLVDAIEEAEKYMGAIVYVGKGTWDIIEELGNDYIESVNINKRGVYLKNRIHLIFATNSRVICNYTGSRQDTITWLSAFNAGKYGFTLENASIESSNCRYSVHDERDQDAEHYENKYINCQMRHDNTNGGYNQCIGGGLGLDGHIVVDGCIFENPNRTNYQIVYWHNSAGSGKSFIEIKDCYFKDTNTFGLMWYGKSTEKTIMYAHGNSIGSPIQHKGVEGAKIENTELIAWNNEIRART